MRIEKDTFWAIIPARGGSKGLPRKNIKELGGFPLIAYSIAICKMSSKISRIIVSTDDYEIADIAKKYGAEVPFMRPSEAASDSATDYEFVKHAFDWFDENEGVLPEFFAHIRVTTPLRDVGIVDKALIAIEENTQYTSLRSAHKAAETPYKWYLKGQNNTFKSILSDASIDDTNKGRESFPDVYIPDGYVDVLKTEYILKSKILHGEMMMAYESPVCTEVDTIEEFEYLEYQIKRREYEVYKYLQKMTVGE